MICVYLWVGMFDCVDLFVVLLFVKFVLFVDVIVVYGVLLEKVDMMMGVVGLNDGNGGFFVVVVLFFDVCG